MPPISADRPLAHDLLLRLHRDARAWCSDNVENKRTLPYVDLTFSFGLARLGAADDARRLMQRATDELGSMREDGRPDQVHANLLRAYRYRIEQALNGHLHSGALPADLMRQIFGMDAQLVYKWNRNKVLRLLEYSRILMPHEMILPAALTNARLAGGLNSNLAEVQLITDRNELESHLRNLLRSTQHPLDVLQVLSRALCLSPRLGENFGLPHEWWTPS
jgi:hypothetical protein